MLSAEMFRKIGNSDCREEKELLCSLNGISLEEFERLWPLEKLGQDILESKTIVARIDWSCPELMLGSRNEVFHNLYETKVAIWYFSSDDYFNAPADHIEFSVEDITPSMNRALQIYKNFNVQEDTWLR